MTIKPPRFISTPDYNGVDRRGQGTRLKLWIVSAACTLLLGAAIYLEAEWRKGVNENITKVPVIEQQATMAVVELRELRKEQLAFYAFFYERLGAAQKAEETIALLGRLEKSKLFPPFSTPSPTPAPR